jgi:hypothetical protein
MKSILTPKGCVKCVIDSLDGSREVRHYNNIVLNGGKAAIVKSLAGDIGSAFTYYVCKMIFGNNGTSGGVPRFVDTTRSGLFGSSLLKKNTTSVINDNSPTSVIFVSILTFSDLVGQTINEMGLEMSDGTLYSMVTFGDINKTSSQQITFNWEIALI